MAHGYSDVAPALAVEVFSPGNTAGEMTAKRADFFAAGTEMFWTVYPDREEIEVSTGREAHRVLRRGDILEGGDTLQGFSVPVSDIFDALTLDEDGNGKSEK